MKSHVQRAIRDAVRKAKLYKRVARAYLIWKTTEKALHDFRAKIDGFLSSGEVRKSTRDWDLRSIGAAYLFGGGPNAFGRYERGEALQMRTIDNLLRLLEKHPDLPAELKQAEAA